MKFYHTFHTDLPDQFVEANVERLRAWAAKFAGDGYFKYNDHVDAVPIVLVENSRDKRYPTFKAAVPRILENWMKRKGGNYSGGYWGTLEEDQRSPARTPDFGAGSEDDNYTISGWTTVNFTGSPTLGSARRRTSRPGIANWFVTTDDIDDKPKPPLKREAIVAGEIIGYRCWRVENGLLRSVYQSDVWKPSEPLLGRELGDWDSRGIHAWKDAGSEQYHDYIRSYLNDHGGFRLLIVAGNLERTKIDRPAMVTGTVWLWGDVVEHERGYRAEHARVRSLDWLYPDASMMGREQETLDELRSLYGIAQQRS